MPSKTGAKISEKSPKMRARKEAAEQSKEQLEQQQRLLERAYTEVAKTEAGRIVFEHLMKHCGFKTQDVQYDNNGELSTRFMLYNQGLRSAYLEVRKYISPKLLDRIETNEVVIHEN